MVTILTALLKEFFGGWRNIIAAGLIAGAVATVFYYVNAYDSRGNRIVELENALKAKNASITVLETNIELLKGTVDGVNARLKERSGNLEEFCAILDEVKKSADPTDDDPVGGTAVPKVFERLKQMEKK